jgi:hypothetical protein
MTKIEDGTLHTIFKILFGILFTIITIITIPVFMNIGMAEENGITPIDPKNVTNQTLQDIPTEDRDLSTGIENKTN